MKKTLIILVLFLSSLVFADDISDFQIEGMSVGDSLLDYFSEKKIKKSKRKTHFKSKEYSRYLIEKVGKYEELEKIRQVDL